MRKNRFVGVFLVCISLPLLLHLFAGQVGSVLAPHRSLASGVDEEGDLVYLPLLQKQAGDIVLVGAGDIAVCNQPNDEATADLLDGIEGTVFTTGDNVYPGGTLEDFWECYESSWGRHKARTRPSPGNHDYDTKSAAGYFGYFEAAAGDPEKGYYSYDLGTWHIVVLNSNCAEIDGGCRAGSPQQQWLQQDLAENPSVCTLAYFHHPRFRSASDSTSSSMLDIWRVLYDYGAEVVVNGHDHNYARFAPQNPDGNADPENGIRQFIVGTGGADLHHVADSIANSEVLSAESHGVLKFVLHPTVYEWEFIPIAGQTFTDAGSDNCR